MIFQRLQSFRQGIYDRLGKARDAVFELMDAVLLSPSIPSLVSLSQSPVFRRKWPSIYAALHDSRPPRAKLMKLMVSEIPTQEQPLLAGDMTHWSRPEAKTLKERSFHHTKGGGTGVGQSYSTLSWVPEAQGSWALPLRHERITSFETPLTKAAFQLKQVTRQLSIRPIAVYDRGYGNASFVNQTAEIASDLLLRLASNRCVWGAPPLYSGRGAPFKHGHKLKFNDPQTWPEATQSLELEDPELGKVKVTRWNGYHFRKSPTRVMDIVHVEILEPKGRKRKFSPLWLAWVGDVVPPLETLWLKYLRRFAQEHWYRFAKQRLYWTLPQLASTQATEHWSDLMPLLSWQLWLARADCVDAPLPWQSPQDDMAPGRVAQSFATIIAAIGTPAKAPKQRGKSPGRAVGQAQPPRARYPTVKKWAKKQKVLQSTPLSEPVAA